MTSQRTQAIPAYNPAAVRILHDLGIPVHRIGYKQLTVAITHYSQNNIQSLTKELYPFVGHVFGCSDWRPVERSIRLAILHAWATRNPDVWSLYFPGYTRAPSNKQFIATLAEYI